ncbi:tRNA (N6-threonylcarbamoyladenosine(37)-N6)-methyltransferase TrmO [Bacillus sp. JJ722]|uniref:tRNA (N6-threonylcarbamoyladenosine(37)-N6)-methyltransferase TrmO n=1 Tax=Bacillus sp. JJ722 TaxID=3122973 RepID=UPI00300022BC
MEIILNPIGYVHNSRLEMEDDHWGSVLSEVELIDELDGTVLQGIEDFSHLEIIFYFDKVTDDKIQYGARHPRNNTNFPKVGIFSQRGKNRPNKLGLTTVELVEHTGKKLVVKGLDAIDGTPIIDIKPVMKEFLPKNEIKQAAWSIELMKDYWK